MSFSVCEDNKMIVTLSCDKCIGERLCHRSRYLCKECITGFKSVLLVDCLKVLDIEEKEDL